MSSTPRRSKYHPPQRLARSASSRSGVEVCEHRVCKISAPLRASSENHNAMSASKPIPPTTVTITSTPTGVRVEPVGDLTIATLDAVRNAVERELPAKLGASNTSSITPSITLDLTKAGEVDASGVGLAVFLFRTAKSRGGTFECVGVTADRRVLVDLALRGQDPQPHEPPTGVVREAGIASLAIYELAIDLVRFCGELVLVAVQLVFKPRGLRVRDTLNAMARHGTDAVPVVSLLGLLIGAIIAFQTFDPLSKYGAKLQVADVVAISIVRELGPLITAIILAGRSGSAFAAEIGTMKVTQELDALRTFGIDPVRFLVMPRMIAAVLVTPLLSVWASMLGVAGGYAVLGAHGFTVAQYMSEVRVALTVGGFLQGLVKAAVFALLVSAIGCLAGLRTAQGPGAVGVSTTRAVVAGIVAIILADSVLGAFFYALGI